MRKLAALLLCAALFGLSLAARADGDALTSLYKQRLYPEVRAVVEARLALDPQDHQALFFSGMLLLEVGRDAAAAIPLLEQAVALAPAVSSYHMGLGIALGVRAIRSGLFDKIRFGLRVKGELLAGAELDPSSIDARHALAMFYLLAPGIAGGSVARARQEAVELSRLDPGTGALVLGQVEEHEEHLERAESLYRDAVLRARGAPERAEALIRLGYAQLHQGRVAEAVHAFEEAVSALPLEPNTHDSLAEARLESGDVEGAMAGYRRALELNPRFEASLAGLARISQSQRVEASVLSIHVPRLSSR